MFKNLFNKIKNGKLSTLNRNQKIIVSITGIVLVLLILVGLTYAYFLTKVTGNENNKSISVSTAYLALQYDDGNGTITATNVMPGETIASKTFTVTNNGNATVTGYGVFLEELVNTFERTSDLKLTITCDSSLYGAGACNGFDGDAPSQNDYLLQNNIDVNEVQTYTLTLNYEEAGVDQSVDMNKEFSAKVQIYSTSETVDLYSEITNYSEGDYVVVNSEPKKSQIYKGTFKAVGLLPGEHTVEVYSSNGTKKLTKSFSIINGEQSSTSTNAYITDMSRTIIASLNVTGSSFSISEVETLVPFSKFSLAANILENGATYVNEWSSIKQYYGGVDYSGCTLDCVITFEEYSPINNITEKIIKTSDNYGSNSLNGLFMDVDDYGTTYYYKGAIVNNYVKFAGFTWRIVRINGDGSVRLILDGITSNTKKEGDSTYAGTDSKFNGNYDDNAYVGYMYGTAGSNNYDSTHKNLNSSTIKRNVDLFYENYLLSNNYDRYLSDTLFCANKQIKEKTGFGKVNTAYATDLWRSKSANKRKLSFKCAEGSKDNYSRYTANSTITTKKVALNSDLTYPIGLLSYDEYRYAGNSNSVNDNKNYLFNETFLTQIINGNNPYGTSLYWLMSPANFSEYGIVPFTNFSAFVTASVVESPLNTDENATVPTTDSTGVRPVINIKPNIMVASGDGTKSNPYTLK